MHRVLSLGLASTLLIAFSFGMLAGCGEDPISEATTTDFSGHWTLTTTVLTKSICLSIEPRVESVSITQTGSSARLVFEDYEANGSVRDGILTASGSIPSGEAIEFELTRQSDALSGTARIDGADCSEIRTARGTPRVPPADFSGFWSFQLVVVAKLCPGVVDYPDCFGIIQSGSDLIIVDDELGNLTGTVTGNVATVTRDNAEVATSLTLTIDPETLDVSGVVTEVVKAQECSTDFTITGMRQIERCADEG